MESTQSQTDQPRQNEATPSAQQTESTESMAAEVDTLQVDTDQAGQPQAVQVESEPSAPGPAEPEITESAATEDPEQVNDLPTIEDLAQLGTELDGIDARLAELDSK